MELHYYYAHKWMVQLLVMGLVKLSRSMQKSKWVRGNHERSERQRQGERKRERDRGERGKRERLRARERERERGGGERERVIHSLIQYPLFLLEHWASTSPLLASWSWVSQLTSLQVLPTSFNSISFTLLSTACRCLVLFICRTWISHPSQPTSSMML